MKAATPWGPSESDLGLQHPSCWTPMWSDCHSMPTLCRMQLVPSFPRGFCFIEGAFNQVTDGGSGLRVEKRRQKKGKLNYLTMGETRWCPCPRLPKYTLGRKQRQHFADSIWEQARGQSILKLQYPFQAYLCGCRAPWLYLESTGPNRSGADRIFILSLPSAVSQAQPFSKGLAQYHGSIWNLSLARTKVISHNTGSVRG